MLSFIRPHVDQNPHDIHASLQESQDLILILTGKLSFHVCFLFCRFVRYVQRCLGATPAIRAPTSCSIFSTGTNSPMTHLWWGGVYFRFIYPSFCILTFCSDPLWRKEELEPQKALKLADRMNSDMFFFFSLSVCERRTTVLMRRQHCRQHWPSHCLRTESPTSYPVPQNAAMWRIVFSLNISIVSLYFLSLYLSSGLYFWATLQLDPEVAQ